VTVQAPDDHGLNLPEDQRVLLFQSVRELLINSAKHAGNHLLQISAPIASGK